MVAFMLRLCLLRCKDVSHLYCVLDISSPSVIDFDPFLCCCTYYSCSSSLTHLISKNKHLEPVIALNQSSILAAHGHTGITLTDEFLQVVFISGTGREIAPCA